MRSQINNLKIRYSKTWEKWQVKDPDGILLEEFTTATRAFKFATDTRDFLKRKPAVA